MSSRLVVGLLLTGGLLWAGSLPLVGNEEPAAAAKQPRKVDFEKDILPIIRQSCVECHGPELQFSGLRLDRRDLALKGGDAGPPVVKGRSGDSLLVRRLVDRTAGIIMPPSFPFFPGEKPGLPAEQIELFKDWIDQGADWPEGVAIASAESAAENRRLAALFAAIRRGEHQAVAELIDDKSRLADADHRGDTPLIYAALFGDVAVMRLLVERGADVHHTNKEGATALVYAAGDVEKVQLLLGQGAKVDVRTKIGRTPLLVAATFAGGSEVVRLLLQKGARISDIDSFGETVLTSASKRGDATLVEELIAAGADLHAGARPPLFWAAEEGNVETVTSLLTHGAAENKKNLDMALFSAAVRGPIEAVRLLLEKGADPDAHSGFAGYTPLMAAAYSELVSLETVQLLIDNGADAKARTEGGITALSLARKRGRTHVVELLEKLGAAE